ncbi:phage tail tube protein [Puerhibacterium puerhi]|uniref:phage tail tube protein n=1 Tax=Puerhibacterium puerhi TaxID=2692623 RepID=UPI0013594764|nr:hypothetical protein [Puerhibacterium puerhi]
MARNDAATLVISTGRLYTAPVGTEFPTSLDTPANPWDEIGHTSLEEIMAIASEGGEATTLGTLQNKNLRVVYSDRTETFTINLQQWDEPGLKLYYGTNMVDVKDDGSLLGVPTVPAPTECAFLAVFKDQSHVFAIYAPKVSIFRGDDVDLADTESLASLPLAITPLQHDTNEWTYAVTPMGRVTGS